MRRRFRFAWPAAALGLLLAVLSWLLRFNGLYGQDAHEYLRQSAALAGRLQGAPAVSGGLGDAEIAGGYPLAAAFLQLSGVPPILALQVLSWIAAALALWLLALNLRVLLPGTRAESRWTYAFLGLGLAPFFVRAGLTIMSDALGLALALAALYYLFRVIELERYGNAVGFAVLAAFAVTVRYASVALLALPGLALALELWRARQWKWLGLAGLAGIAALTPLWWLKSAAPKGLLAHSLLEDWSLVHLFQATFTQASGTVSYALPNLVYLFYPLAHPGFCLSLPALLLLGRRTDAARYSKRLLLLSLLVYLGFLGGLSHQNVRYLLPAYALLLLLFYPAWDRFYAYGLYFFKRLTLSLMGAALFFQIVFTAYFLAPTLRRNRLETSVANEMRAILPDGAVVYAFDLDIALKSYLPAYTFKNLWLERYDSFPTGTYFLFNEPRLQEQWAGKNPMLNWEKAQTNYKMNLVQVLPDGWVLYRIDGSR